MLTPSSVQRIAACAAFIVSACSARPSSDDAVSGPVAGASSSVPRSDPVVPTMQNFTVERVALWKWNAEAAYTITHDDLCDTTTSGQFDHALAALRERGLHAAFGAIVEVCERRGMWSELQRLINDGHEIMNHGGATRVWSRRRAIFPSRSIRQRRCSTPGSARRRFFSFFPTTSLMNPPWQRCGQQAAVMAGPDVRSATCITPRPLVPCCLDAPVFISSSPRE